MENLQPDRHSELRNRVVRAAESALANHQYVSAIDVLTGTGLLAPTHVESWRKGRIDFLERAIPANLKKISQFMAMFHEWALEKGLKPSETHYRLRTRAGGSRPSVQQERKSRHREGLPHPLCFPRPFRAETGTAHTKLSTPAQPVVFEILRNSMCSECGAELPRDSFLSMEAQQPLCLPCARLGDLEFLPAGDAARTRRAARYSGRNAVVVRFSRSRGRYERQGILVERSALEKAEQDCSEDAAERAKARAIGAAKRQEQDRELIARMTLEIRALFPGCPPREAATIAAHTATRNSGRVGRTAAGRSLDEKALTAAVIAAVRHKYSHYDELLAAGMDRLLAREHVADRIDSILEAWRVQPA